VERDECRCGGAGKCGASGGGGYDGDRRRRK
jgi:hypothetical protein